LRVSSVKVIIEIEHRNTRERRVFKRVSVVATSMILLIGILAYNVQPIKATGIIYIEADGSVNPPSALIQRDGDTYRITGNLNSSIIVKRDSLQIEGKNHTVEGDGTGDGIDLSNRSNITIRNVRISFFSRGINLNGSEGNLLHGNAIAYNDDVAISISNSSNNIATNNIIFYNVVGVRLKNSHNNTVTLNRVTSNFEGIYMRHSNNNTIKENFFESSNIHGVLLTSSNNNTISRNTVSRNDKGISLQYSENNILDTNIAYMNNLDGISLVNSSGNNLICNIADSNNKYGIVIHHSGRNTLVQNSASNNTYNFKLAGFQDFHFDNNIDTTNLVEGKPIIYVRNASNRVYDASTNAGTIYVIESKNLLIENLILSGNEHGILLWNTTNSQIENVTTSNNNYGIFLQNSNHNILTSNRVNDNEVGINLQQSNNNALVSNTITPNNGYGIHIIESNNNTLASNTVSFNYKGMTFLHSQNMLLNYNKITANYEGLTLTYTNNSVLMYNVIDSNTWYGVNLVYSIQNNLTNNNITQNLFGMNLQQSYTNTIIHNNFVNNTKQVRTSSANTNLWDNAYPSGGNCWSDFTGTDIYGGMYQNLTESDGIGDTQYIVDDDNQDRYPLMNPYFSLTSDVNDDRKVDMYDMGLAGCAFGSYPGHSRWNPHADIRQDNSIDMRDLGLIARNFGKTYP